MISSILLAAGESLKMGGENKLTKEINGMALINHAVKNILGSAVDELIIVLGYEKLEIENIIEKNKKIKFVYNENYKTGISSSIKEGLKHISKKSDAFFICLGNMPNVNQNIYNKIIKVRYNYNKKLIPKKKKEIIIPIYEEKEGNPILFSKFMKEKIFSKIDNFEIEKIIETNKNKILYVPIQNTGITLDFNTQKDFIPS